jgi:DNA-binding SARP family transcriptional activator/TolB-like protein
LDPSAPVSKYRLETFGKLVLTGGASAGQSQQRRRLALLALLAASGDRGQTRDQLLGFLWPESSSANARHSLDQLLHAVRRALGESIFKGANPVSLDPEVVSSDVDDFQKALKRGALAEAVDVYNGPFLQGFYLDDATEFERWASSERGRLAGMYAEALSKLAEDAEGSNDHASALRWRHQLAESDPVSSRFALGLMRAYVASGDRTAALKHARTYEALVHQELESQPDPSITAYAAALRAGTEKREAANKTQQAIIGSRDLDTTTAISATDDDSSVEPVVTGDPLDTRTASVGEAADRTHQRRRSYWWPIGIVVALAIFILGVWTLRNRTATPPEDSNRIVVVPFRTADGDSSVKYLGEGVVDLISPMLTGEGGPVAVDSRTAISTWNRVTLGHDGTVDDARQVARELGAGLVLSGALVNAAGRLTMTGSVISQRTGDVRTLTSVSAPADSVDQLLDAFVGQLLVRQSGVAETSVAEILSRSLPAIRAYLDGRAAYRRNDEDRAIENFTRAIDIDSTFALAALELSVATGKLVRAQTCQSAVCQMYSVVPGFPPSARKDELFNRGLRLAWDSKSKLG